MSKLIFFDVDGTLVDEKTGAMPASARLALKQAQAKGNRIFIDSGRTLCNFEQWLLDIGFDGLISGCGAHVELGGEVLCHIEQTHEQAAMVRETVLSAGVPAVYEADQGMYFEPEGAPTNPEIEIFRDFAARRGTGRLIPDAGKDFRFVKFFLFTEDTPLVEQIMEKLGRRFSYIDRGGRFWGREVVPAGCSKATGIEMIRNRLGVPLSDCYAVGDSENDLPMLLHVPHGIAMGNGMETVKAQCSFVAPPLDQDGLAAALAHFDLI